MKYILHWCKVLLPHERNTDATKSDPAAVPRLVSSEGTGPAFAPSVRCSVCGEERAQWKDAGG